MVPQHYEIPRRHKQCEMGNEEFDQGTSYFSLIEPIQGGGYERKDYCLECWNKLSEGLETRPEGEIYWKSKVPLKQEVSQESLRRDERALKLLKETHQSESQEDLERVFVLALLLTRNKLLQLKQEVQEDNKVLQLYEVRATEEMLFVQKVDLSSIQTDLVRRSLAEKLGG